MAINLISGFIIGNNEPVDQRLILTKEQMLNINEATQPECYFCVCKDDLSFYLYSSSFPADPETGKFRVLSGGAGSYTLPIASETILGGVKVDGVTITIDADGVIKGVDAYTKDEADNLLNERVTPYTVTEAGKILSVNEDGTATEWIDFPEAILTEDNIVQSIDVDNHAENTVISTTGLLNIINNLSELIDARAEKAKVGDLLNLLTVNKDTIVDAINEVKSSVDGITVPTKTSDLTNDSGFITSIPSEYITETELETKGYLTEHQSLTDYAKKTDIPDVSDFLTEVPAGYVTDTKLSTELDKKVNKEVGKGLSTNDLTNELVTKINSSATEAFVTNAIANAQLGSGEVDLSGYATIDALNLKADLTHTHDQYLTKVPDEYITETELNAKGYLTEHQDISNLALKSEIPDVSSFITSDDLPTVPTKVSDLANDKNYISSIPSEYITETELKAKGYLTSHQDISGLQTKTDDSLTTTDKTVIGAINELKTNMSNINTGGGSSFSGSYNDLTDKPTIPTKTSDLNNDSGFIGHPDVIVINKGDSEVDLDNDIPLGHNTILLTGRVVYNTYGHELVFVYRDRESSDSFTIYTLRGDKVVVNKLNGNWSITSSTSFIYRDNADSLYQKIEDNTLTTTAETVPGAINELKSSLDGITVPTKTSDLENDRGYLTSIPEEYITETELNAKGYLTSHQDISGLQTKTDDSLTTTDKTVIGAINEVNSNLLDTVGFSTDYKNIILNRKSGLNPYTIPISTIINNASLAELKDVDSTDVGDGKILVYDGVTNKHKYVDSSITDEFVKMDSTTNAKYLSDLIDKSTVVNDNGVLKVKKLDGQEVTITEINYLKGLTMNVMDLVSAFANGGVKVLNNPLNTASELDTMNRTGFIDGVSYIVYVLADENHAGAKTTYLVDKTNTTFFGNADSQRDFTTNPLNLANEVTGKLGTSNIDVDNLWTLLTINDTYKTLTTNNEIFGTHGAKAMYDELTIDIGGKANATDLTTHTGDANIHVATTDKAKWDKVTDKLDAVDFNTHKGNTDIHITGAERTKWDKVDEKVDKTDIVDNLTSTDIDKPLSANQGKILNDTKLNKTDTNKLNCVVIDNVSLKEYILTNFKGTEKTYYLIAKTTCTDLPKASNFFITVETPGMYTYKVTAKELNDSNGSYVCTYRTISSTWTEWEKVLITGDISGLQTKTDDSLTTTDKTVIGAINEVNSVVTTEIAKVERKLKLIDLGENADADNCRIEDRDVNGVYGYCGLFTQNVPMEGYAEIRCYHYGGGIRQFIDYTTKINTKTYTRFIQYNGTVSTDWQELATMDKVALKHECFDKKVTLTDSSWKYEKITFEKTYNNTPSVNVSCGDYLNIEFYAYWGCEAYIVNLNNKGCIIRYRSSKASESDPLEVNIITFVNGI